jgi:DNA-directed RNA polymerase subunit RPC12/RpoP
MSQSKHEEENYPFATSGTAFTCGTCKGTFTKPLLATVSTKGEAQKYYACPRCMVKVSEVQSRKRDEDRQPVSLIKDAKKPQERSEDGVKCGHFLGYLKSRPKDASFPEECLTCERMIQCLVH